MMKKTTKREWAFLLIFSPFVILGYLLLAIGSILKAIGSLFFFDTMGAKGEIKELKDLP